MDAPPAPAGQAPSEEVLFLIVQALADGPFAELGEALAAAATAQGLLPRRRDIHGAPAAAGRLPCCICRWLQSIASHAGCCSNPPRCISTRLAWLSRPEAL